MMSLFFFFPTQANWKNPVRNPIFTQSKHLPIFLRTSSFPSVAWCWKKSGLSWQINAARCLRLFQFYLTFLSFYTTSLLSQFNFHVLSITKIIGEPYPLRQACFLPSRTSLLVLWQPQEAERITQPTRQMDFPSQPHARSPTFFFCRNKWDKGRKKRKTQRFWILFTF